MSSNIQIGSPLLKKFVHADVTIGATTTEVLSTVPAGGRRIALVIQNLSSTATIQVILADTGDTGIRLYPLQTFTQDAYNGTVRLAGASGTQAHVAYALS